MTLIVLDVLLIALLGSMIFVGLKLNENLKQFREIQKDFIPAFRQFQALLSQIVSTTDKMKSSVHEASSTLIPELPKIQEIRDDLKMLVDHSEKHIERLESNLEKVREVNVRLNKLTLIQEPVVRPSVEENSSQALLSSLKKLC